MDLWMWVHLFLLVDVRQVSVVPFPVAFQAEPVLSFVVRVGSLLEPPAELEQWEESFNHAYSSISYLSYLVILIFFIFSISAGLWELPQMYDYNEK